MTPEAAVAKLTEILAERPEFTEDEIYQALEQAGVPDGVADRAYKFTQIAWGRTLLDGLGVRFSPEYLCFNAEGECIESGQLAEEPYYTAALKAAAQQPPPAGLPHLAMMSADFGVVNSALNGGSNPKDLVTGPAALFMEYPTAAGMEKAQRILNERLGPETKKPWWRFW